MSSFSNYNEVDRQSWPKHIWHFLQVYFLYLKRQSIIIGHALFPLPFNVFSCKMVCAKSHAIPFVLWNATWILSTSASSSLSLFKLTSDKIKEGQDKNSHLLSPSISYMRFAARWCKKRQRLATLQKRLPLTNGDMAPIGRVLRVRSWRTICYFSTDLWNLS